MVWSDVDALNAAGNEIGGHTVDHVRLTNLTPAQQHQQICDDADALRARGYTITSFAYPFGAGAPRPPSDPRCPTAVSSSARLYGELRGSDCPGPQTAQPRSRSRRPIPMPSTAQASRPGR